MNVFKHKLQNYGIYWNEWMNAWMNLWRYGCMGWNLDGWKMGGLMGGWVDRWISWMNDCMNKWVNEWMDEWMYVWMSEPEIKRGLLIPCHILQYMRTFNSNCTKIVCCWRLDPHTKWEVNPSFALEVNVISDYKLLPAMTSHDIWPHRKQ